MTTQAVGGAVRQVMSSVAGVRPLVVQHFGGDRVLIGYPEHHLGFSAERGVQSGREFARQLARLTAALRGRAEVVGPTPADSPVPRELLEFTRDDPTLRGVMQQLKGLGGLLRMDLNPDVATALKGVYDGRERPMVAVQRKEVPPVRWEMLYDATPGERQSEVNWNNFWGFRARLTHWPTVREREENLPIQLSTRGLSVACESLSFSAGEVERVWERVRSRVGQFGHDRMSELVAGRLGGWVGATVAGFSARDRLAAVINPLPAPDRRDRLLDAVCEVFHGGRWDLCHFACHCDGESLAEALTSLCFQIAGCPVNFSVAHLGCDKADRTRFVFLNACGSAAQNDLHQPPGFPLAWIETHGALAVVATVCPVPDAFAHQFALAFYGYLVGTDPNGDPIPPLPLASAMVAARRYFMETFNNPLGLAYTLYADAGTDIDRGAWR